MPIYEYECTKGHRFEAIQKVSDAPLKKCETCRSKVERLISSPAIQFKGTGWYVTDYAGKGSAGGKEGKSDESKSASSSSKSEGGESKSSTKKEKAGASK